MFKQLINLFLVAILLVTIQCVHAQTCKKRSDVTTATDTYCGAELKSQSCCSDSDIAEIKSNMNSYETNYGSACADAVKQYGCQICYVSSQKYYDASSGSIQMCQSACIQMSKPCSYNSTICSSYPTSNCWYYPVPTGSSTRKVNESSISNVSILLIAVILGIFMSLL